MKRASCLQARLRGLFWPPCGKHNMAQILSSVCLQSPSPGSAVHVQWFLAQPAATHPRQTYNEGFLLQCWSCVLMNGRQEWGAMQAGTPGHTSTTGAGSDTRGGNPALGSW